METKFNTQFGDLAVSEGFATSDQLNICQRIVNAYPDGDSRKSIDVILLDRGYITPEQRCHLLKKMGITILICPYCNKRFQEAGIKQETIISCKYCGGIYKYNESPADDILQIPSGGDKTLVSSPPVTSDRYIGKSLGGKYEIVEKIATGGWSTVYKAKRTLLDISDIVAVKILHVNLSDNPQDIKRFYTEASTIRELHHPNAIHLYDFDRDTNGTIYMAMEYIQGKNLKETLKNDGPFDVTRMLTIILQVCDVISTAHKHPKKIIHRDITPQNIMLAKAGKTNDFVKVLDFGIAKLWTQDNISMTGSILGTPLYMAPEQWKGECDERTDIYSLGMVMYEMLAGKPPFHGDQHILMNKHLHEKPPHFNKVNKSLKIPLVIENIVFKCLEKKKEKRPQSIDELALLLKNAQNSKLNRTRYAKVKLAVTVLVSLTISSITYLFFLSHQYKDTIPDKTISTSEIPIKTNKIPAVNTGPLLENSHKHEQLSQDTKPEININSLSGKEPDNTISVMPNNTKKEHIDTLQDTPQDNISKLAISTTKNTDKVVDNVKKYDINKKPEPTNIKTRKNEQTATEIQIWLQEYKKALETGDIETLKNIGHISSEKEEDKLRQHYSYINNFSISVQNEAIKLSNNRNLAIVSFDRTDEWIDERGNQHKENLPRITKILRKENNIWKITK